MSLSDNDEVVCCVNSTEFVIKSYSERCCVAAFTASYITQKSSKSLLCYFCSVCRLNVVTFQVKLVNFDGMSKTSALFYII